MKEIIKKIALKVPKMIRNFLMEEIIQDIKTLKEDNKQIHKELIQNSLDTITQNESVSEGIPMLALFKAIIEMFGITAFQISDDGNTLIINGDIKISGSNKLLKNL